MPMVALTHRLAPEKCNWTVEAMNPMCESCSELASKIVEGASAEYDLKDPVSMPFFPLPPSPRASGHHVFRR